MKKVISSEPHGGGFPKILNHSVVYFPDMSYFPLTFPREDLGLLGLRESGVRRGWSRERRLLMSLLSSLETWWEVGGGRRRGCQRYLKSSVGCVDRQQVTSPVQPALPAFACFVSRQSKRQDWRSIWIKRWVMLPEF